MLGHADTGDLADREELDLMLACNGTTFTALAFRSYREELYLYSPSLQQVRSKSDNEFFACFTFEPLQRGDTV